MVKRRNSLLILTPLPGAECGRVFPSPCRSADGVVGGVALACARRVATIELVREEALNPGARGITRLYIYISRTIACCRTYNKSRGRLPLCLLLHPVWTSCNCHNQSQLSMHGPKNY
jgi:hypothetical protein